MENFRLSVFASSRQTATLHPRTCRIFESTTRLRSCTPSTSTLTAPSASASVVAPELAAAEAAVKPATHGLTSFELKPAGMKGAQLFAHISQFAQRDSKHTAREPSSYLDVEITAEQKMILAPTAQDPMCRALMADAGGQGAQKNLAKRKLDNIGDVKAYCGIQNDAERIRKLQAVGELAASISEIPRADKAARVAKKIKVKVSSNLLDAAPAAVAKLKVKGGDISKLTKPQISSLALKYFGTHLLATKPKGDLVTALRKETTAKPTVLTAAMEACGGGSGAASAAATGNADDDGSGDEDQHAIDHDDDDGAGDGEE